MATYKLDLIAKSFFETSSVYCKKLAKIKFYFHTSNIYGQGTTCKNNTPDASAERCNWKTQISSIPKCDGYHKEHMPKDISRIQLFNDLET